MRKLFTLLIALLTFCSVAFSQVTTTIQPPTIASCGVYNYDVTVAGFTNVGSISLKLNYDPLVYTYSSVTVDPSFPGAITTGAAGTFSLAWFNPVGVTLADGSVLLTLTFQALPAPIAGTTNLTWSVIPTECEYANPAPGGVIPGCIFNNVSYSYPADLTASISPLAATICPNGVTVSLTGTASNGTPPYAGTVSWTGTATPFLSSTSSYTPTFTSTCSVGSYTLNLTVTDAIGCTASTSTTVTVADVTPPVPPATPAINYTTEFPTCANATDVTPPVANDACSGPITGVGTRSDLAAINDSWPLGTTTITWTFTDLCVGNTSTCTQTVTVTDDDPPVLTGCPTNITTTTEILTCEKTVNFTHPTVTDNCSVPVLTYKVGGDAPVIASGLNANYTFPKGTTTVLYTATDVAGNTATCSFTVTVNDITPPTIVSVPSPAPVNNTPGLCSAPVYWVGPSISDNCVGVLFTSNYTSGNTFPVGTTTVIYTATDASSNVTTASFVVTVLDNELPTITCSGPISVNADAGVCTYASIQLTAPPALDNCSVASVLPSPSSLVLGANTVTWTVTDGSGNTANCTQAVTVIDTQLPTITCGGPISVNADLGVCTYASIQLTAPPTADNCTVSSVVASPSSLVLGANTVTWTVTDNSGLTANCTQSVTVVDAQAPTITCAGPISVNADLGVCTYASSQLTVPPAADNCSYTPPVASPVSLVLGANTVTWTVTDGSGNTANCTQTVTVLDTQLPTITCGGPISVNADLGVCTYASIQLTAPPAADNCSYTTPVATPASLILGANTVTWTVTDGSGNSANCTQTVTVVDAQAPTITCGGPISVNADAGVCTYASSQLTAPPAADNCSYTTPVATPASLVLGANTVTWTVTDGSGNTANCTQTVTVIDNQPPSITCPATVNVGTNTLCTYVGPIGTATATDNCTAVPVINNDAPPAFPLGTTTVIWMATDVALNTSTCSQTVIVTDDDAPTITCPANISVFAALGVCDATVPSLGSPTTADNCGVFGVVNNHASTTYPVGVTTVTWTVTDNSGNTAACNQTVTVIDNQLPTIVCPTPVAVNNDYHVCGAAVTFSAPVTTDNCPGQVTTQLTGLASGSVFPIGITTNTFMVTDASNNTATCSFTITVTDSEVPEITCPGNITTTNNAGLCSAVVTYTAPVGTDNCPAPVTTQIAGFPSGSAFPVGVTTNTFLVTDIHSNTTTCSFTVTVSDNELPTITCGGPISVNADAGVCTYASSQLTAPPAADNCSYTTPVATPASLVLGANTVTWTVTDGSGNTANCTQTVTVVDAQAPTITCGGPISVNADAGVCTYASSQLTAPPAADNCSYTTPVATPASLVLGANTVTWTVTDGGGNTANCTQTVTVLDIQLPTITCGGPISVNADAGVCTYASSQLTAPPTADNCTVSSVVASPSSLVLGANTVTWTVTDGSGNSANCTQTVTVVDAQAPTITCGGPISVNADAGVCTYASSQLTAPPAADNCSYTTPVATPSSLVLGANTVTWTVTDGSGNTANCTQTVTVVDTQVPTITCAGPISVNADAGVCTYASSQLTAPPTADNCTVSSVVASPSSLVLGANTVTWTVTDGSGNTANCTQTVTVLDNQPPTITCAATAVNYPADLGVCTYTVPGTALNPTVNDNCSVLSVTNNYNGLSSLQSAVFPFGSTTVVWTVTDGSSNTAICSQTIVVVDTQAPIIAGCPANVSYNTSPVSCTAIVSWTIPTVTDNCNPGVVLVNTIVPALATPLVIISGTAQGQFDVGVTTVYYTADDGNGNTSTCSFTVTIIDNTYPTITGIPANITLPNTVGQCSAQAFWGAVTASDNCPGVILVNNYFSGQTFPVGTTTVIYTATDVHSNVTTASFTITVNDTQLPTITCATPAAYYVTDPGVCTYTVPGTALNPTAFGDNCPGSSVKNNFNNTATLQGAVLPKGTTTVVWTVTDASLNAVTCNQVIIVKDMEVPVITRTGSASVSICQNQPYTDLGATVADNCDVLVAVVNNPVNTAIPGTYTVTYTATDLSGNIAVPVTRTVIVNALPVPTITGPTPVCQSSTGNVYSTQSLMTSYIWAVTGGTITSGTGTNSITVTWNTAGTQTVGVTSTDGNGCTGTSAPYSVLVNPTPNAVATPASQTKCSGIAITTIALTGSIPGTVFNWTRDNTATVSGIAASGSGNISGTLTNTTNAPVTVTFTITPTASGCPGSPITATVLVNPTPNAVATPASQTVCSATAITTIVLSGNVSGTLFNWTRDNTATATGITASGSGNIIGTLTNTTNAPVTVTFTITPTAAGCPGPSITATVLVNPTPNAVANLTSQTKCSGVAIDNITFTGVVSGTVFNWTRDNTVSATGISASGSGTISGTLTNTTFAPVTVTFTITPMANGCPGSPITSTVLVNPTPNAFATPSSQTVCSAFPITGIVLSGNVSGTVFNWTRDNTATVTGISASGSGNINGTLTNTTGNPITVAFTVTPTANGCPGTPITATVLVNPTNTITLVSAVGTNNQSVCTTSPITTITYNTTWATGATFTGLPAGINGSWASSGPNTGVVTINGVSPATVGVWPYTVTLTGGCGTVTASGSITTTPPNTISLYSPVNTTDQIECINQALNDIIYTTTNATGATITGLPAGVTGGWVSSGGTNGIITIGGVPTVAGVYNWQITLTGGCGLVIADGTITVNENTIVLTSAAGTNAQTKCIYTALTPITYATTGASGATITGLPTGVTGSWASDVVTISGNPSVSGTFNYTINLVGGCGTVSTTGTITVTPNNTVTLTSVTGTDNQTKCINTALTTITYSTTGATGASVSGLPAGVTGTWVSGVVTISGTPTVSGTFPYTVTLTGGCGSISATGTITVTPNNTITLTSATGTNLQTLCISTPLTTITYSTTGATGATITGLPAGVTGVWASNVVTISGTPTAAGTFPYTVTLTGGCGSVTATGTITVTPNNTVTLTSVTGTDNQTKCINTALTNITYATTGATGATVTGLPAGVTGVWTSGVVTISGTPTVSGTFTYTVSLTGGCGNITATGTITVNPNNTITVVGSADRSLCINTLMLPNITFTTTGATGASFAGLPAGVTGAWSSNVVTISGTPTVSGIFTYTVTLTGGCGVITATGTITVTPDNTIVLTTLPTNTNQTVCINTPINNITYTSTGATGATFSGLPAGVTGVWVSNNVTISGSPSVAGFYNYVVTLTGGCGIVIATGTISVTPNSTLTLTSANSTQTRCINTAIANITYTVGGSGTGAGVTGLPAGVTGFYSAGVFTISGTPTVAGTYTYTVTTTGPCAQATATGTITVTPNNTIVLSSATGTDNQTKCINTALTNITYTTTGATGATVTGLPTGVSGVWASNVVTISGTPSVAGTFPYTVTLTGGCAVVTTTGTITVTPNNVITLTSGTGSNIQTRCINTAISAITYSTTGATGATVTGLPAGVTGTWASNVVTISGTPSVAGTFTYTVTLTGGCGVVTATGTITVTPNNTIVLSSATGTDNQTKCINTALTNITYTTTGATGATVTGLPTGVSGVWASNVVTISGTPTVAGTFPYTVTLSGGCGTITTTGTITVTPNNTIAVVGSANRTLCILTAIAPNITFNTTGATGATFAGLPTGVTGSYSSNVVTISGIPTVSGTFNYTVTLTGGCGIVTANGTISVTPDNTITLTSAIGTTTQTVCISTPITTITYTTTGATGVIFSGLPAGVTANWASNIVTISGTPSVAGTFNYVVTLTGGCGTILANGILTVTPNNTISVVGSANQTLCINTAMSSINFTTTGATGATFAGLPTGVTGSYASNVVTISGTPSVSGVFPYTVTLTGGCGTITATGTITVTPNNTITLNTGNNNQTLCVSTAIATITYSTTGATGATFSGLPAGITGSWASNVVTISGTTPAIAGVYPYTVTLTGGCGTVTASGTITVQKNTVTLSSAAGTDNQSVCNNVAITPITYATTLATGATFSGLPTGVSGTWSAGVATISGIPSVTGTFPYTVALTGGCGVVSITGTITVIPNSTLTLTSFVATTNQVVCINAPIDNITYVTTNATGATITGLPAGVTGVWASNVITISGAPSVPGTFDYLITLTGACGGPIQAIGSVTANPRPIVTLTGPTSICINTPGNVYTTEAGFSEYTWSVPAGNTYTGGTALDNTITVNWLVAGTQNITVNYKNIYGCVAYSPTILPVTVMPNATATLTSAAGTNAQTAILNSPITTITYGFNSSVTGATVSGLPAGVSGVYSAGVFTISGTPTILGLYTYTITTTGSCVQTTATGTINVIGYKVSGYLTYDKPTTLPLAGAGVTVYLKSGAEPVPPATLPVPTVLYSVNTDVNGYYEFYVPNGTYYLYAANTAAWTGVAPNDVTNLQRYIANLLPNTVNTPLRVRAADINQDGLIQPNDVTPLQRRIANILPNPNYKAPNWLFENPTIVVNNANVTQNFKGIVSGDVNGSYPSN